MAFFSQVDVDHHHIGERCPGLLEKVLYVCHRLPQLLVDPVAEDARARVSSYLPTDRKDISAADSRRLWPNRTHSTLN